MARIYSGILRQKRSRRIPGNIHASIQYRWIFSFRFVWGQTIKSNQQRSKMYVARWDKLLSCASEGGGVVNLTLSLSFLLHTEWLARGGYVASIFEIFFNFDYVVVLHSPWKDLCNSCISSLGKNNTQEWIMASCIICLSLSQSDKYKAGTFH